MKDMTLLRLKHTARLEKMITEGCNYDEILTQSKKLDEYITYEMKKINEKPENAQKNSHIL